MTLSITTQPFAPTVSSSSILPSITGSQLSLPSSQETPTTLAQREVPESNATLDDLPFDPCMTVASADQVEICTKIFHSIYNKEDNYRFIDPSEADSAEGSITTVLKGVRPCAIITANPTSAYILALKTIPSIHLVQNSSPECFDFFIIREGEGYKRLHDLCIETYKYMQQRATNEGYGLIKCYRRILASSRTYGEIFHYHPDAITAFEEKVKKMLETELAKSR